VALWGVFAATLVTPLVILRSYQQKRVQRLLQSIASAPRDELPVVRVNDGNGLVRLDTPSLAWSLEDDAVHARYVVAEFGGSRCETLKLDMTYRYEATEKMFDFTRKVTVQPPLSDRPVQVFLPMYFRRPWPGDRPVKAGFGLRGVELQDSAADCLTSLATVRDPARLPVLMDLHLRPHWESATLYGTIVGVESRVGPDEFPIVHTFPSDLAVKRSLLMTEPEPFQPHDIAKQSRTFQMRPKEWRVAGVGGVGGRGPFLYLVEMKPRLLKKGSYVVAQGIVERGGLSFGIVRGDAWVAQVPVTHRGRFAVVVKVPDDAEYKVVLANNLATTSLENHLVVTRAGIVAPTPGDAE
jgi:hypothetical protein